MLVRRAEMLPIECIVRGYLSGSAWKEYQKTATMHGTALPAGLRESDRLPEPVFTPSTKATDGHDENISYEEAADLVGTDTAMKARALSLAAYERGAARAFGRGIVIADTKFELGFIDGELAICDEILTPDSVAFLGRECLGTRHDAAVVRQAAGAGLGREHRLGQGVGAPADPGGGRRSHARPLRGRLRTDHRTFGSPTGTATSHVKFTAVVEITGREGIADPQGQTIERALPALGFEGVEHVRVGKVDPFRPRSSRRDRRTDTGGVAVRPAAGQSRHRTGFDPLRSRPERLVRAFEAGMSRRLAVVVFPGSNCEHDVAAVWTSLGGTAELVWHTSTSLGDADAVVLPGGFAHGDYLRPGAIARFSPVMGAVARFAADGWAGARDLQRLPGADRGGPASRGAMTGTRGCVSCVRRWSAKYRPPTQFSHADTTRSGAAPPDQPLRGQLHLRRDDASASSRTTVSVVLRYRARTRTARCMPSPAITNRERQCRRSDAPPRACERPDARFSRRAIAARVRARCFGSRPPIRGRVRP